MVVCQHFKREVSATLLAWMITCIVDGGPVVFWTSQKLQLTDAIECIVEPRLTYSGLVCELVQYHLLHAVSLLALSSSAASNSCGTVAKLWIAGTAMFSVPSAAWSCAACILVCLWFLDVY